ncbi:MAG: EAL domain-containing protein [Terriglobales bacterium]
MAISLILFVAMRKLERQNAQTYFERLAQERFDRLESNVALNLNDIVSLGSYFDAARVVRRQEFARLTAPLLANNRAIQALEWSPIVSNRLRRSFEDDAHRDGLASFQLTERLPDGQMAAAAERPNYVPVLFVEPLQGNEKALGFDLSSNPARKQTIRRSTDSGNLVATGRITLVQETAGQYGVLVLRPVYRTGAWLASEKERREALTGFVLGVIRVGDMVETASVAGSPARSLGLIILDLDAAPSERLLYPKNASLSPPAGFRSTRTIFVAGRNWQVSAYPLPGAFTVAHWNSWTVLVTGLLFTGICAAYLGYGLNRHFAIERVVTERTAALHEALDNLRESEARYKKLVDLSPEAILVGRNHVIVAANKTALELFDVSSPSDLIGRRLADFVSTGELGGVHEAVEAMYACERHLPLQESRVRRDDGVLLDIEVAASSFQESGGGVVQAVMRNITERKQAEERLRKLSRVVEQSPASVVITDVHGNIQYVNPKFTQITGYSAEEAIGQNPRLLKSGVQSATVYRKLWETVLAGGEWYGELANKKKNGEIYWEAASVVPIRDTGGVISHLLAVKEDITERRRVEKELRLAQFSLEHASDAVYWMNSQGRIVYANEASCASLGRSREELLSLSIPDIDPLFPPDRWQAFWEELKTRSSLTFEVQHQTKQGRAFPVEITATYLEFDGQEYSFAFARDITDRKVAEERVQTLAYYDALTGLPNRTLLRDRLSRALATARRQKHKVALLFLDLDRFKIINDSLGHSVGDLLLQEVAGRLSKCSREQDTVARLGGDEFLIVLTDLRDIADVAVAAERFMDAMTAVFVIHDHVLRVSCSLGISIFPEHGADSEALIKNADAAMYSAKDAGRNNFQFFTADMNAQAVQRLTLENSLRLALDREELFLVYQPQMDMATGTIIGLEALVRWQHPELGLVSPSEFIPIAENSGLIMPIGEWVLRTACSQVRKWQEEGLAAVSVAVNVSAVQFRQEGFPQTIRRVLNETGLAPQYLELELTESLLLSNADVMFSVLQQLMAMGLSLAIDDFGTGYSSLSYLKRFPVSKLKIDRSFIQDVAVDVDDAAITSAIISMAKSLNLKVIAEGVENEAQMSFLRDHRCDEIQGYYFSKPLAADEAADKLRAAASELRVRAQASGR